MDITGPFFRRLDGLTWGRLDPRSIVNAWILLEQRIDPGIGPLPGPILVVLYRVRDGDGWMWVQYRYEFDPFAEDQDQTYISIYDDVREDYARRELAAMGVNLAAIDRPGSPPIECSQAELGDALGYEKGYAHLIEKLKARGIVGRFERADGHRWRVWLSDPKGHERVRGEIERSRAEKGTKRAAARPNVEKR
jgi:hypothetical protein